MVAVVPADPVTGNTGIVIADEIPAGLGVEVREPIIDPARIRAVLDGVEYDPGPVRELVLLVQPNVAVSHVAILLGSTQ